MVTKQVICIHIGQAGVQCGSAIWEALTIEQGVKLNGTIASDYINGGIEVGISSFFAQLNDKNKYIARALFVDTESTVIDEIRVGAYRDVFNSNCLISGFEDASNLFPRGYGEVGKDVLYPTLEGLRMLTETADSMHSIILVRSIGGGTGSGTVNRFLDEIEAESSKITLIEVIIFPAPCISTCVVEPYNALLSVFQSMRHINMTLIMDNQALYDIAKFNLTIKRPSYFNINRIIAQVISSLTASLRFNTVISSDFSIIQTNIVPYPRLKYPVVSYVPLIPSGSSNPQTANIMVLTEKVFNHNNFMTKCFPEYGEYIACALLYRGNVSHPRDISLAAEKVKSSAYVKFVDWSPSGIKTGITKYPPSVIEYSCIGKVNQTLCLVANNTCIAQIFDYLLQKFDLLYQRKAYIHWFTGEGLEEAEFGEARKGIIDLLMDYMKVGTIKPGE